VRDRQANAREPVTRLRDRSAILADHANRRQSSSNEALMLGDLGDSLEPLIGDSQKKRISYAGSVLRLNAGYRRRRFGQASGKP